MIFNKLAEDILEDKYFLFLYHHVLRNSALGIFEKERVYKFTKKQLNDILRFSDILSNSDISESRKIAFQIVALLNDLYATDDFFKVYSNAILSKLGNFPALRLLKTKYFNDAALPLEREIEKNVKLTVQAVPNNEAITFTDQQYNLYRKLTSSTSFSFSGPTSMGKSFMIKTVVQKIITDNEGANIVIIVPTRALINQYAIELNLEYKDTLIQYRYKVYTNSNIKVIENEASKYVFVLTPERLLSLLSQPKIPKLDYLFVDEAHKLATDGNDLRSITLYSAIERTLSKFNSMAIYFASPNTDNPEVFLDLFNKKISDTYRTLESPVVQNLYYVDLVQKHVKHISDYADNYYVPTLIKDTHTIFDLITKIGGQDSNIIYCNSTSHTISKAMEFSLRIGRDGSELSEQFDKTIKFIKTYIHKDYFLIDCLQHKIGFHFSTLPQTIRRKVEELFKAGEIRYMFCTPTLLEGINLPAKNIFILSNKKGKSNLSRIDFWNLAGRAGRLKYDLSGNIYCVRETEHEWKNHSVLKDKTLIKLEPNITKKTDKNIDDIEKILSNQELKSNSKIEGQMLKYIANIISIESTNDNSTSRIVDKLSSDKKETIVQLAREYTRDILVPREILNSNQSINIHAQNSTYVYLQNEYKNGKDITLPYEISYMRCVTILYRLHQCYNWQDNEDELSNINRLRYFAFLMNQWMNGITLNHIINDSIDYYAKEKKSIFIYESSKRVEYNFSRNDRNHVNVLINETIDNIDKILRYALEKYLNNYYLMVVSILGEDKAGANWSSFLEYGTNNSIVIALQNLGFSRHVASSLVKHYSSFLEINNYKLVNINKYNLLNTLDKDSVEYEEISELL